MIYKLKDSTGAEVNTIVASEEFVEAYCKENNFTYEMQQDPAPTQPTPAELREQAYETEPLIEWQGELLTVDAANDLWLKYSAEGSEVADTLSTLIAAAKAHIRELYPDEV